MHSHQLEDLSQKNTLFPTLFLSATNYQPGTRKPSSFFKMDGNGVLEIAWKTKGHYLYLPGTLNPASFQMDRNGDLHPFFHGNDL